MTLAVPNPSTAAAGAKQTATTWNKDVRDAVNYLLALQGGVGRRNVLTNSHMSVWQRGTSFAIASSTKTYTADRWVAYRTATGSTVSRQAGPTGQSYGLRYQRDSGNTSLSPMQIIQAATTENSLKLAGQAVSVRLNLQAGANFSAAGSLVTVLLTYGTGTNQSPEATWTGTLDALNVTQAITTTATDYTFDNIVIPTTATQVKLSVSYTPVGTAGANDWVQLNGAQVTVGSAAGFERLPVEATLAECSSFYQAIGPYAGAYAVFANGSNQSAVASDFVIPLPVPMRVAPTVTFSATNHFTVAQGGVVHRTSTNMQNITGVDGAHTTRALSVRATTAGVTTGYACKLTNEADTTNAAIYAESEL